MPWVEKILRPHDCRNDKDSLPDPQASYKSGIQMGSIYECDKPGCVRRYRLNETQRDGMVWSEVITYIQKNML